MAVDWSFQIPLIEMAKDGRCNGIASLDVCRHRNKMAAADISQIPQQGAQKLDRYIYDGPTASLNLGKN